MMTDAGNERAEGATPAQRMTWAQRLRRVFQIDVETCQRCGGTVKIIASIEDDEVIEKILAHAGAQVLQPEAARPRRIPAPVRAAGPAPGARKPPVPDIRRKP